MLLIFLELIAKHVTTSGLHVTIPVSRTRWHAFPTGRIASCLRTTCAALSSRARAGLTADQDVSNDNACIAIESHVSSILFAVHSASGAYGRCSVFQVKS